jgi:predicted DNA-binding protein (MmcQ/YjbR family)
MTDPTLDRLRAICLALPDTKETITWGQPHFRVGEKIFCGYGEEHGRVSIGFKLERPHADLVVDGDRYRRAPYVGQHGWVSMDAARVDDWELVRAFVLESYRLIAPKASQKKMAAGLPAAPRRDTSPRRKSAAAKAGGRTPPRGRPAKRPRG